LLKTISIAVDRDVQPAEERPTASGRVRGPLKQGQRPTQRVRLRAFANQIKQALLGNIHDPTKSQHKELVDAGAVVTEDACQPQPASVASVVSAPVLDARTFESWWLGKVGTAWSKKIEACDRVLPGSSLWDENSHLGSPIQRHMAALDVRCDDRMSRNFDETREEEWLTERMDALDKCMQSADRCWSVFSHRAAPSIQAVTLIRRLAPDGKLPQPAFTLASPKLRSAANPSGEDRPFSGCSYEIPDAIRRFHCAANKFGLLQFLVRLGVATEGARPWWYSGWVFDLASVAAMAQFYSVYGDGGTPDSNVGEDFDLIVALNRVIFDHEDGTITPFVTDLPRIAQRLGVPAMGLVKSLMAARREYYTQLAALGIGFEDVYVFAKPVEIFGAKTIGQNMLWRGRPPESWQS